MNGERAGLAHRVDPEALDVVDDDRQVELEEPGPRPVGDAPGAEVREGVAPSEGWGAPLYPWESQVDASGLPLGLQLVGPVGRDARLLEIAGWVDARLSENS